MKKKLIGFGIVAVIVAVAILYFTRTSVNTNTEIHAYIQTSIEQNSGISLNVAVKLIGAQLEDDLYEICDNNCEDCKRTGMQCVVDELLNDNKIDDDDEKNIRTIQNLRNKAAHSNKTIFDKSEVSEAYQLLKDFEKKHL